MGQRSGGWTAARYPDFCGKKGAKGHGITFFKNNQYDKRPFCTDEVKRGAEVFTAM